jgi:DNA-binding CsgD family transcriptional regulator
MQDDRLDAAVDRFFEAAAIPALVPDALDRLARACGSRGAMLATPILTPEMMPISRGLNESSHAFFEEGWYRDAVRTTRGAHFVRSGHNRFLADHDIFNEQEIATLPYYVGFARKHDVPWFSAAFLAWTPDYYVALSLNRHEREGRFLRRDLARLDRILPRLQQAAALGVETMTSRARGMVHGFGCISVPAFLMDAQDKVVDSNSQAEALIGKDIWLRQGRLMLADPRAQARLDELVARANAGAHAESTADLPVSFASASGGRRYVIHLVPVVGAAHDVFGKCRFVVLINALDRARPTDLTQLRAVFGLTAREADVAALLADGHSIEAIGERLKLRVGSVRDYVKIILAKSDTHRQAEFVSRVARLMIVNPARD